MKSICLRVLFFSFLSILPSTSFAWECEVVVSGPGGVKLDQSITLSAEGTPPGGSYSWSRTPNLVPNGSTATLTGFKSDFSDYIGVTSYYTTPKGTSCSDRKWIWVCLCDVSIEDSAPDRAKVGEEITLSASTASTGGTYLWSLSSGTGTIIGSGSSAMFIADQAGEVEVRLDYTPPEGGEPCKDFHTILIEEDCSVEIAAEPEEVSLGGLIHLTVTGKPANGTWQWTPADGLISGAADGRAVFTPPTAGQHTLVAKHTPPGGQECEGETTVSAYKVQSLNSKHACFASGDTLQQVDFDLLTTPTGYENKISFNPATVSTPFQTQEVAVTGSCGDGELDDAMTMVTVVNSNEIKKKIGISIEIPNALSTPLETVGLAEQFDLSLNNTYEYFFECCGSGVLKSTSGETALDATVELANNTIYGIPLPKSLKNYVTLDILQIGLLGTAKINIKGDYYSCDNKTLWTGNGNIDLSLEAGSEAKVEKKDYIVLKGSVKGQTTLKEEISTNMSQLTAKGTWSGLDISGTITVKIGPFDYVSDFANYNLVKERSIPYTLTIDLPSIKE